MHASVVLKERFVLTRPLRRPALRCAIKALLLHVQQSCVEGPKGFNLVGLRGLGLKQQLYAPLISDRTVIFRKLPESDPI